jgi:hypothetical protein
MSVTIQPWIMINFKSSVTSPSAKKENGNGNEASQAYISSIWSSKQSLISAGFAKTVC